MEYYFYVILIFAIVLKLTVYLCWYQVRRSSNTREVRIIMPDGSTRCAVVTAHGRLHQSSRLANSNTSEERQNLPQADMLAPYDNQGMVESPVQPHYGDSINQLNVPPPYANQEWKLPKYEEVAGMPPPYSLEESALASVVQPGDSAPQMPTHVSVPPAAAPPTHAPSAQPPCSQPLEAVGGANPASNPPPTIPCYTGQM